MKIEVFVPGVLRYRQRCDTLWFQCDTAGKRGNHKPQATKKHKKKEKNAKEKSEKNPTFHQT